jgi:hypothetical protein
MISRFMSTLPRRVSPLYVYPAIGKLSSANFSTVFIPANIWSTLLFLQLISLWLVKVMNTLQGQVQPFFCYSILILVSYLYDSISSLFARNFSIGSSISWGEFLSLIYADINYGSVL